MKVCFIRECCDISISAVESFIAENDIEISELKDADIVIYLGCAFEKGKIDRVPNALQYIIHTKKTNAKLGVFGCITKYEKVRSHLMSWKQIDYVGNAAGLEMQEELRRYLERQLEIGKLSSSKIGYYFHPYSNRRLNIVIQDGCNNRCYFCKSNYLNLRLISRPIDDILCLIERAHNELSVDEINITGLNPTQYGTDLYGKKKLTELIKRISSLPYIRTILLDMLCIQDMTDDLLTEIINNPKIKRLMIPVQTLDNRLLARMGRQNTVERTIEIFQVISSHRPDIFLETIFLACYPTETKQSVDLNIEFLNRFKISNPVVSSYCYGNNVETLKSERIVPLYEKEHQIQASYYYEKLVPLIEQQRRALLSNPVTGRLVSRNGESDIYSTDYRFCANEYSIVCPTDKTINLGDFCELSTDFLPSRKYSLYHIPRRNGKGHVLKRLQ